MSAASINAAKRTGQTTAVKKCAFRPNFAKRKARNARLTAPADAGGGNTQRVGGDVRKLADAEEAQKLPTVSLDLRKRIQQARMEKKLTQKELAHRINEKHTVVQAYENGKAVPSTAVLAKMERALGVKLRGQKK